MSTHLTPFLFEEDYLLRSLMKNGEPWFVLADICRVLEIGNPSDAARRLDGDERDTLDSIEGIHSGPGNPNVTIINESGLYSLILTSRKPEAKRFKKWVTAEVLPSIRKTGAYGQKAKLDVQAHNHAIRLMKDLKQQRDPVIRRALHAMLTDTLSNLGIAVPALEDLGHDGPQPSDLSIQFFSAVAAAGGLKINHARDPRLLAVNLNELNQHASTGSFAVLVDGNMRRALKADPCYRGVRTIRSAIDPRRTLKCWVFASEGGRE